MKKNKLKKVIIIIILLAVISYVAYKRIQKAMTGPEVIVGNFYEWYINYDGNALMSGAYKESGYLTNDLIKKIDESLEESKGMVKKDPFTCSQSLPDDFSVSNPIIDKSNAGVTLAEYFENDLSSVKIALKSKWGGWRIDSVICPQTEEVEE